MEITSKHIKASLLYFFGFKKSMYTATELTYGKFSADILCFAKKDCDKIIEIEVKTSKSDFLKEFESKEMKHGVAGLASSPEYPNVFYFAVPESLVDFVKQTLIEKGLVKYGIIQYKETWKHKNKLEESLDLEDCISIVKPAKKLRELDMKYFPKWIELLLRRNCNEIVGLYKERIWNTNRYKPIIRLKETDKNKVF